MECIDLLSAVPRKRPIRQREVAKAQLGFLIEELEAVRGEIQPAPGKGNYFMSR